MEYTADYATKKLVRENRTISFMESCTSGLLASMFTDTEGASSVFTGSLVTYSNEQKIKAGVDSAVIEKFGVYSEECACAMAATVQKIYGTDIAIGITGTTGNVDPKNGDSIPGEAYYCIRIGIENVCKKILLDARGKTRKEIKQYYADEVYKTLGELIS